MSAITTFMLYNNCDNTHETISSYNVFAVYLPTIYEQETSVCMCWLVKIKKKTTFDEFSYSFGIKELL